MRADSKYIKTLVHPGKLEVRADLSQIGGSPERFEVGFVRSVFVHEDGTLKLPGDAGRWLGFAAKGKSHHARKARRYTPPHPFHNYAPALVDRAPKGGQVTQLIAAKLISEETVRKTQRMQLVVSQAIIDRNLAAMWNAVWRRVLPFLDQAVLKLAREVGDTDTLTAYNKLLIPEWRSCAEESKVLVATLLKQKVTELPKNPYKHVGLTTPALKAWAQRQRMFPVYGVSCADRHSPDVWVARVAENFKTAKVTKREVERTLNHITRFRMHNKIVTAWYASGATVRAFYNYPAGTDRLRVVVNADLADVVLAPV